MKRFQQSQLSLLFLALMLGCGVESTSEIPPTATVIQPTGRVKLEFVLGDDVKVIELEDVAGGTTLESLMRDIPEPEMEIKGTGTTAFVNQIGDQATSASEGWTFRVDGEFAHQGIGTTELEPPTTIRWTFGDFEADQ